MTIKNYVDFYNYDRANRRQYRKSGVYGIFIKDECVYVGESNNLHYRFTTHAECFSKVRIKDTPDNIKYKLLQPYIDLVEWRVLEVVSNPLDVREAEAKWISHYKPIFNINLPDKTRQYFTGTADDIAAFIVGDVDMDYLKTLISKNIKK